MIIDDIISHIQEEVQDDGLCTPAKIIGMVNRCQSIHALELLLPDLSQSDTVDTVVDDFYAALPADYHKFLWYAYSGTDEREISIAENYAQFIRYFPTPLHNTDLPVETVCAYAGNLYYQYIPEEADTLTLKYYRQPTVIPITGYTGDIPDAIPAELHSSVFIPYVCWKFFQRIEQGTETKKTDTGYFKNEYAEGVRILKSYVDRKTPEILGQGFIP